MKASSKILVGVVSLCVIAAGGGGYAYWHHQQVVQQQELAAKQAAAKKRADYRRHLLETALTLTENAALAAQICGDYSQVWSDTIDDGYITVNGHFTTDFSEAVQYKQDELDSDGTLDELTSNDEKIQSMMSKLQNPPKGFEKAYADLEDAYKAYSDLEGEATNPTGSLVEFNQKVNSDNDDVVSALKLVRVDVPEK
ncbi:MAG: hypothetical protein K6T83_13295 [Alicyclobacillus sp.]|nr:hypothetical protein [Alicyclobacillus sp.]